MKYRWSVYFSTVNKSWTTEHWEYLDGLPTFLMSQREHDSWRDAMNYVSYVLGQ